MAACTAEPQQQANTTEGAPVPVEQAAPPPPTTKPTTPAQTGAPALTAEGFGPLKIGMTRAEITAVMGKDANPELVGGADPEQCDQYRPAKAPEGMLLMVETGRLTRISLIRDAKVKTDKGLALGATPAQVRAAYGTQLQSGLHEYEAAPAQYLVAWDKGGGPLTGKIPPNSRGIVYEVNATGKVGSIHAGGPSVLYVEGCS